MGDLMSKPSSSNPSSSDATTAMSSSQTHNSEPPTENLQASSEGSSDPPTDTVDRTLENQLQDSNFEGEEGGEEEEEAGECGFCVFMKAGGCRDSFIEWENCVQEGEKNDEDIVEKCYKVTAALKTCMEAHSDYYSPILKAEKAAEEEAKKELEKQKEGKEDAGSAPTSPAPEGSDKNAGSSNTEKIVGS